MNAPPSKQVDLTLEARAQKVTQLALGERADGPLRQLGHGTVPDLSQPSRYRPYPVSVDGSVVAGAYACRWPSGPGGHRLYTGERNPWRSCPPAFDTESLDTEGTMGPDDGTEAACNRFGVRAFELFRCNPDLLHYYWDECWPGELTLAQNWFWVKTCTKRTPRSTSRRAIKQREPYSCVAGSSRP